MLDEIDCQEFLRLLLVDYRDVDKADNQGRTPLFYAASSQHPALVQLLLDQGANVTHTARNGSTCLDCAVENSARDVVELLLDHGVPLDQPTNVFGTPLHHAVVLHQRSIVDLLADSLSNVDLNSREGMTPIMLAIRGENLFAVRTLLQHNCSLRWRWNKEPPLLMAVLSGQSLAARMLLTAGCSFTLKNLQSLSTQALRSLAQATDETSREEVIKQLNTPASLRGLCRIVIRNNLQKRLPIGKELEMLGLPTSMKDFIAIKELDELDLSREEDL
jgi:ankyrin repeat protein